MMRIKVTRLAQENKPSKEEQVSFDMDLIEESAQEPIKRDEFKAGMGSRLYCESCQTYFRIPTSDEVEMRSQGLVNNQQVKTCCFCSD